MKATNRFPLQILWNSKVLSGTFYLWKLDVSCSRGHAGNRTATPKQRSEQEAHADAVMEVLTPQNHVKEFLQANRAHRAPLYCICRSAIQQTRFWSLDPSFSLSRVTESCNLFSFLHICFSAAPLWGHVHLALSSTSFLFTPTPL